MHVDIHCCDYDFAPMTSILSPGPGLIRREHVIVVNVGDASIYLTQIQAVDLSLALTRASSDVDRAKAAPLVAEVER